MSSCAVPQFSRANARSQQGRTAAGRPFSLPLPPTHSKSNKCTTSFYGLNRFESVCVIITVFPAITQVTSTDYGLGKRSCNYLTFVGWPIKQQPEHDFTSLSPRETLSPAARHEYSKRRHSTLTRSPIPFVRALERAQRRRQRRIARIFDRAVKY